MLLGGAAAAWPLAVRAQQGDRMRRIGVLMPLGESDPEARRRIAVFTQALRDLGWSAPHTITFEYRYADGNPERLPALASELVQSKVDVIVTQAAQPVEAARNATATIPIVMASVGDAVGGGYVASLARPGGNLRDKRWSRPSRAQNDWTSSSKSIRDWCGSPCFGTRMPPAIACK